MNEKRYPCGEEGCDDPHCTLDPPDSALAIGDRVRYVPNENSPRDADYVAQEGRIGTVLFVNESVEHPYRVAFPGVLGWGLFSESELVKLV